MTSEPKYIPTMLYFQPKKPVVWITYHCHAMFEKNDVNILWCFNNYFCIYMYILSVQDHSQWICYIVCFIRVICVHLYYIIVNELLVIKNRAAEIKHITINEMKWVFFNVKIRKKEIFCLTFIIIYYIKCLNDLYLMHYHDDMTIIATL